MMDNVTTRICGMVVLGVVCCASIVVSAILEISGHAANATVLAVATASLGGLLGLIPPGNPPQNGGNRHG